MSSNNWFLDKFLKGPKIEKTILKDARRSKDIIYGARSVEKQIGTLPLFQRQTQDYDIFTGNPKSKANKMQRKLDRVWGGNEFYEKKGKYPGTWKVKGIGPDQKKGTEDDYGVVDYTRTPKPRPRVKRINGVLYRDIRQEVKAKERSLQDPTQKFRHHKDQQDLHAVNYSQTIKGKGMYMGMIERNGKKFKVWKSML